MGAEHSQQRPEADGREIFENEINIGATGQQFSSRDKGGPRTVTPSVIKRRNMLRQSSGTNNAAGSAAATSSSSRQAPATETASPTSSEVSRAPSPPLSVCSDLPYVSYTDRPIGDSPKIRSKPNALHGNSGGRGGAIRKSYPGGAKPKRPQSTAIVIVKPGANDNDFDVDPDLAQLRNIPQFLPVIRESITSAAFTRDPEILERLHSQHLLNICSRMQTHLNVCASHVAAEQNHLVERTKIVSNSITTLFASFVDMQKAYASYAEQFAKIRAVSQQLSRCNSLMNDNIASLEAINNFLDVEDRLEPFVWRTDDNKLRGEAEGAVGGGSGRLTRF